MRTRTGWLGWLLAAGMLLAASTARAQGEVENFEVVPTPLAYPLGHPRYENGGFFACAEFAMFRQDNPLQHEVIARRGFVDTLGQVTGVPNTFVGSNAVALDVQQAAGPLTYQPGTQLTGGWLFQNGVAFYATWMHLADAKYAATASFIPFNFQNGRIQENTFLTSGVFNFPPEFLGPLVKYDTPTNPPVPATGNSPGIWNGSTLQQILFVQRFDQVDATFRVPIYQNDCWRSYGLVGARAVVMWERFSWRVVDYDVNGMADATSAADYSNIVSNRLYGPHLGWGNEMYLGSTPIGAFAVSVDFDTALMMDIVKERAKYELEDRSISASRKRDEYTLVPELSANIGIWWYPIQAIQVRIGYDVMTFMNTIGSRQPVDFNYGALAPEWNHIPFRFFDGFRAGIGFVF
jgi:hypothetical protein